MRKIKLLKFAVAACLVGGSFSSNAQLINLVEPTFIVNSPSSVAGSKAYTVANDGDPAGTGNWGRAIDSFWYNIPVGIYPTDTLGCTTPPVGTFSGKFALISRGTCQFSEKAYNAQLAGAIAIIIYNNTSGGPVGMAAGNNAASVTIPVIMISQDDGVTIANLLKNSQPVTASLTNWGFGFTHDLAIVNNSLAFQSNMAIPKYELNGDTAWANRSYLGALVANVGASTETNLKLKSVVSFFPSTGSPTILAQDSITASSVTTIDSVIEMLSPRAQVLGSVNNQKGRIDVQYTLTSNSTDNQTANNVSNYSVIVTDSVYSKGRLKSNGEPVASISYRFANSAYNTWGPLFYINSAGHYADKVQFTVSNGDNTTSLDGSTVTFYVFKWVDISNDNLIDAGELNMVGAGAKTFTASDSNFVMFTQPLDAQPNPSLPFVLDPKSWYWVAAEVPGTLYLGCDGEINYFMRSYTAKNSSIAARDYWAPQFQGTYADLQSSTNFLIHYPFSAQTATDIDSVSFVGSKGRVPAITLHTRSAPVSVKGISKGGSLAVYPNPASNLINVKINADKVSSRVNVTLIDAVGRITKKVDVDTRTSEAAVDVSGIPSGNYFLVVRDGSTILSTTVSIVK